MVNLQNANNANIWFEVSWVKMGDDICFDFHEPT
jgi:hypothetical protein